MASIKLLLRGKKNPSNLTVRFVNGRACDIHYVTAIQIKREHWDSEKQQLRNISSLNNRYEINAKLAGLKAKLLEQFNMSFITGDVVDREWVAEKVSEFFNRPKQEVGRKLQPHFLYYEDFALWWLKEKGPTWKTASGTYLKERAVAQYVSFIEIFKKFQGKRKIKVKDVDDVLVNRFVSHLETVSNYSPETVRRHIGRLRFFMNRAKAQDLKVTNTYNERVYVNREKEDIKKPYLNEDEINLIYNLDLSHDEVLDNARDSFIIGLWTGLRISDLNNNLDISNIKDGMIEILTIKTQTWVTIPLHPHVKAILAKRFNNLPSRVARFNDKIKLICQLCGIDNEIKGYLHDVETNRRKLGVHPKYKLISSHICRRSFATNLFGTIPNRAIQTIGGWSTEDMMLHYIKKTRRESADLLQKHWEKKD